MLVQECREVELVVPVFLPQVIWLTVVLVFAVPFLVVLWGRTDHIWSAVGTGQATSGNKLIYWSTGQGVSGKFMSSGSTGGKTSSSQHGARTALSAGSLTAGVQSAPGVQGSKFDSSSNSGSAAAAKPTPKRRLMTTFILPEGHVPTYAPSEDDPPSGNGPGENRQEPSVDKMADAIAQREDADRKAAAQLNPSPDSSNDRDQAGLPGRTTAQLNKVDAQLNKADKADAQLNEAAAQLNKADAQLNKAAAQLKRHGNDGGAGLIADKTSNPGALRVADAKIGKDHTISVNAHASTKNMAGGSPSGAGASSTSVVRGPNRKSGALSSSDSAAGATGRSAIADVAGNKANKGKANRKPNVIDESELHPGRTPGPLIVTTGTNVVSTLPSSGRSASATVDAGRGTSLTANGGGNTKKTNMAAVIRDRMKADGVAGSFSKKGGAARKSKKGIEEEKAGFLDDGRIKRIPSSDVQMPFGKNTQSFLSK